MSKLQGRDMIDVWDCETFDSDLKNLLLKHKIAIESYVRADQENTRLIIHENARGHLLNNPHSTDFREIVECAMTPVLSERTIRAWHYSRLCDHEVEEIKRGGIEASSTCALRRRLLQMTERGLLLPNEAEDIFLASPYHQQIEGKRLGMFWMTSIPHAINSNGIVELVENWGGESVYFNHHDSPLATKLKLLGSARVLEIAIPLNQTKHSFVAAEAVVSAFVKTQGLKWNRLNFSLTAYADLPASCVNCVMDLTSKRYLDVRKKYASVSGDNE